MNRVAAIIILLFFCLPVLAFNPPGWQQKAQNPEFLHRSIKQLTDIMVHDIYAPPVASRTYSYVSIAAYEAAIFDQAGYRTLAGQVNGLTALPKPAQPQTVWAPLAAVHSLLLVGKTMVISEARLEAFHQKILGEFKKTGMPKPVYDSSLAWGAQVARHIIAWSQKDGYRESRSFPKYSVDEADHTWKPTPPAYMKAVEPNWSSIRPFIMDSAGQFRPVAADAFATEKESKFYKDAHAVWQAGKNATPEQVAIANFWDCNPYKMNTRGHVMFATKKISPGGHWINITALACRKAKTNFTATAEAYACVAMAIADGFISCWDEKYRSNVIRPETYINQYIDPQWTPQLQTPPFPEYTSGHSVISGAAALMLTKLFGAQFSYADNTEVEFGLPVRHFTSFEAAAQEAAISRFYGGIHYMPAIENGMTQGKAIASFMLQKIATRTDVVVGR
ncbi:vanadium-dependent haloperoxidase [Pseudocnuella soli]|uniref:vanadium-dependent haloperoxidase n=1 Tax=Pseudocnuella soli TaxID=2502779 RepID=UPI001052870F|nr:vanadium-dependent haloperoxidase [Pseudocnuella soli]